MNNIDTSKSYATEENLMKVLRKHNLDKLSPLIVCNRAGRFTAIFGYGFIRDVGIPNICSLGFKVIG